MPEYDYDTDETYPTRKEEADEQSRPSQPKCFYCHEEGIEDLMNDAPRAGFWTDFGKFLHHACVDLATAEGVVKPCKICDELVLSAAGQTKCSFCTLRDKFTDAKTP